MITVNGYDGINSVYSILDKLEDGVTKDVIIYDVCSLGHTPNFGNPFEVFMEMLYLFSTESSFVNYSEIKRCIKDLDNEYTTSYNNDGFNIVFTMDGDVVHMVVTIPEIELYSELMSVYYYALTILLQCFSNTVHCNPGDITIMIGNLVKNDNDRLKVFGDDHYKTDFLSFRQVFMDIDSLKKNSYLILNDGSTQIDEDFFFDVGFPIIRAYTYYKKGDLLSCKETLKYCKSKDWELACTNYVNKD